MAVKAHPAASPTWVAGRLLHGACVVSILLGAYVSRTYLAWFVTGPGSFSRIIALLVVATNLKGLPFAWSVRVLGAYISHLYVFKSSTHGPHKLFHPVVSQSHVPLLEIDYNMHKSNGTFFTDLDVSRAHLMHLLAPAMRGLWNNAKTKMVMNPSKPNEPAKGCVKVIVGAVQTSFKRELRAYQRYGIWTRILSWDRKWLYIVSYFVEKGAVKPRSWDIDGSWPTRSAISKPEDWEKKVLAISMTKLVFKIGRLTIHPAIVLGESGLLPPRPGGWTSGDDEDEATSCDSTTGSDTKGSGDEPAWDWRRTEAERLKGYEHAQHFAALDDLNKTFEGGEDGAVGKFWLA
ncbi:hypothetical protein NM208_g2597 [Fusarium decemcellulare]|uniref:Uncharacterized protein n=2 Tax=Fusarium decemcellulare TaxID=57161 RepID=A0ACC1SKK3_9HYPO|nr:hypothetical protein NM208_g4465 [Fusarium decemcellulare]KAJ3545270.1 hypothetical protein NM208_g2597 [Fusarium decemcellulare]